MKRLLLVSIAVLSTLFAAAQTDGDRILGNYAAKLSHNDAKAKIIKHNGGYRMQIYWLRDTHNADGSLKVDSKNPDKSKRHTPLTEVILVDHVTFEDGVWKNGRIYDPHSGKSYKTELRLNGKDLDLRGIVGPFHKSIHWTKIQ